MNTRSILAGLLTAMVLFSGLNTLLPRAEQTFRDQVAVLMYHHVHDTAQSSSTISTSLFREQLTYLREQGYHFISLQEFEQYRQGAPVPDKAVLVTFDDGYDSFYYHAYPILKELDVPAVNFIITHDLESPKTLSIPALSREEIRTMLQEAPGLIDVQCHTHNLHYKAANGAALTTALPAGDALELETPEQQRTRVLEDSRACARELNALYGREGAAAAFAYPFGIHSPEVQELIAQAGFGYAFTIVGEMAKRNSPAYEIPRINAGNPAIDPRRLDKLIGQRVESTLFD